MRERHGMETCRGGVETWPELGGEAGWPRNRGRRLGQ